MSIKLQFEQMKMTYDIVVKKPDNFQALQILAFDKAWECVTNYFKSLDEPLPKSRHGNPSYTFIRNENREEIRSNADLRSSLEKGMNTFQVSFKVAAHPSVPFVPFSK